MYKHKQDEKQQHSWRKYVKKKSTEKETEKGRKAALLQEILYATSSDDNEILKTRLSHKKVLNPVSEETTTVGSDMDSIVDRFVNREKASGKQNRSNGIKLEAMHNITPLSSHDSDEHSLMEKVKAGLPSNQAVLEGRTSSARHTRHWHSQHFGSGRISNAAERNWVNLTSQLIENQSSKGTIDVTQSQDLLKGEQVETVKSISPSKEEGESRSPFRSFANRISRSFSIFGGQKANEETSSEVVNQKLTKAEQNWERLVKGKLGEQALEDEEIKQGLRARLSLQRKREQRQLIADQNENENTNVNSRKQETTYQTESRLLKRANYEPLKDWERITKKAVKIQKARSILGHQPRSEVIKNWKRLARSVITLNSTQSIQSHAAGLRIIRNWERLTKKAVAARLLAEQHSEYKRQRQRSIRAEGNWQRLIHKTIKLNRFKELHTKKSAAIKNWERITKSLFLLHTARFEAANVRSLRSVKSWERITKKLLAVNKERPLSFLSVAENHYFVNNRPRKQSTTEKKRISDGFSAYDSRSKQNWTRLVRKAVSEDSLISSPRGRSKGDWNRVLRKATSTESLYSEVNRQEPSRAQNNWNRLTRKAASVESFASIEPTKKKHFQLQQTHLRDESDDSLNYTQHQSRASRNWKRIAQRAVSLDSLNSIEEVSSGSRFDETWSREARKATSSDSLNSTFKKSTTKAQDNWQRVTRRALSADSLDSHRNSRSYAKEKQRKDLEECSFDSRAQKNWIRLVKKADTATEHRRIEYLAESRAKTRRWDHVARKTVENKKRKKTQDWDFVKQKRQEIEFNEQQQRRQSLNPFVIRNWERLTKTLLKDSNREEAYREELKQYKTLVKKQKAASSHNIQQSLFNEKSKEAINNWQRLTEKLIINDWKICINKQKQQKEFEEIRASQKKESIQLKKSSRVELLRNRKPAQFQSDSSIGSVPDLDYTSDVIPSYLDTKEQIEYESDTGASDYTLDETIVNSERATENWKRITKSALKADSKKQEVRKSRKVHKATRKEEIRPKSAYNLSKSFDSSVTKEVSDGEDELDSYTAERKPKRLIETTKNKRSKSGKISSTSIKERVKQELLEKEAKLDSFIKKRKTQSSSKSEKKQRPTSSYSLSTSFDQVTTNKLSDSENETEPSSSEEKRTQEIKPVKKTRSKKSYTLSKSFDERVSQVNSDEEDELSSSIEEGKRRHRPSKFLDKLTRKDSDRKTEEVSKRAKNNWRRLTNTARVKSTINSEIKKTRRKDKEIEIHEEMKQSTQKQDKSEKRFKKNFAIQKLKLRQAKKKNALTNAEIRWKDLVTKAIAKADELLSSESENDFFEEDEEKRRKQMIAEQQEKRRKEQRSKIARRRWQNALQKLINLNIVGVKRSQTISSVRKELLVSSEASGSNDGVVSSSDDIIPKDDGTNAPCPLCEKPFEFPVLLPCCHTVCKDCVSLLIETSDMESFTCPVCSGSIRLTDSEEELFCPNFLILQQRRSSGLHNNSLKCSTCDEDKLADEYCEKCHELLCNDCVKAHKRVRFTRDHVLVEADPFKHHPSRIKSYFCTSHPEEQLQFHCNTCEMALCGVCARVDHVKLGHDCMAIKRKAEIERAEINASIDQLQQHTRKVNAELHELNVVEDCLRDQADDVQRKIRDSIVRLIAQLHSREKQLLKNVKDINKEKWRRLKRQRHHLESDSKQYEHCTELLTDLQKHENNTELLQMKLTVDAKIRELENKKHEEVAIEQDTFLFKSNETVISDEIQAHGLIEHRDNTEERVKEEKRLQQEKMKQSVKEFKEEQERAAEESLQAELQEKMHREQSDANYRSPSIGKQSAGSSAEKEADKVSSTKQDDEGEGDGIKDELIRIAEKEERAMNANDESPAKSSMQNSTKQSSPEHHDNGHVNNSPINHEQNDYDDDDDDDDDHGKTMSEKAIDVMASSTEELDTKSQKSNTNNSKKKKNKKDPKGMNLKHTKNNRGNLLSFTVLDTKSKPRDITIQLTSPNRSLVSAQVAENTNGTMTVYFCPKLDQDLNLFVSIGGDGFKKEANVLNFYVTFSGLKKKELDLACRALSLIRWHMTPGLVNTRDNVLMKE